MAAFLVNATGVALMAAIVWWFWLPGSGRKSGNNEEHQH